MKQERRYLSQYGLGWYLTGTEQYTLGVTELKWMRIGHIQSEDHTIHCSGHEKQRQDAIPLQRGRM